MSQRVAIVTGASRGFGRAVTLDLLRAGWMVVGDGRDEAALQRLCVDAAPISDALNVLPGDISSPKHLGELVRNADRYGSLKLVVNNAGTLGPTPLPELVSVDIDALAKLFDVNVAAQLRLIQLSVPSMQPGGAFVSVISDAALNAYAGWGAYGASKAALDQLTAVLAVEQPTFKWYRLDPGDMCTDMQQAAYPGEDISANAPPEASSGAVLDLLSGDYDSGRYSAAELLAKAA